ncbi:MAG: hypothetical protein K2W88_04205, partial [Pararheinheimera sp.]|nr:hypothetical protein [Rheinheimera sp.]
EEALQFPPVWKSTITPTGKVNFIDIEASVERIRQSSVQVTWLDNIASFEHMLGKEVNFDLMPTELVFPGKAARAEGKSHREIGYYGLGKRTGMFQPITESFVKAGGEYATRYQSVATAMVVATQTQLSDGNSVPLKFYTTAEVIKNPAVFMPIHQLPMLVDGKLVYKQDPTKTDTRVLKTDGSARIFKTKIQQGLVAEDTSKAQASQTSTVAESKVAQASPADSSTNTSATAAVENKKPNRSKAQKQAEQVQQAIAPVAAGSEVDDMVHIDHDALEGLHDDAGLVDSFNMDDIDLEELLADMDRDAGRLASGQEEQQQSSATLGM